MNVEWAEELLQFIFSEFEEPNPATGRVVSYEAEKHVEALADFITANSPGRQIVGYAIVNGNDFMSSSRSRYAAGHFGDSVMVYKTETKARSVIKQKIKNLQKDWPNKPWAIETKDRLENSSIVPVYV
jgi:hypothetical protein